MGELALGFVANNPFIDKILVGVENIEQFNDDITDCNYPISDKDLSFISSLDVIETDLLNPSNWH